MLPPVLRSVVCLSVTLVRPTQPVQIFSNASVRRLVPLPPVDIHGKFYGDHPRRIPSLGVGGLTAIRVYMDISKVVSRKRRKIGGKLVLITNRKSCMRFRLIAQSVTSNDLELRNGPYFA